MATFPECLGVFTLPNVVLFPHAHLPIHIFEPRYRKLLRDALEGDRMFVMAVKSPDDPEERHPTACAASIVEHQPLPDGRSDVILRGERVVELGAKVADKPYPILRVHPLPREGSFREEPGAAERLAELMDLFERVCPGGLDSLRPRMFLDPEDDGGLELLHTVAMHLPVDLKHKLDWLARPGSLSRWLGVRETLRALAAARASRRRTLDRYADLTPKFPGKN
jgi:Lon protease-like protein